jgi:excisionase family DNA binding protein
MTRAAPMSENGSPTTLLSVDQVAAHCGLSHHAIYRAIERGELRASRLCGRLRIAPKDLETWITSSVVVHVSVTTTGHEATAQIANRGFRDRIRPAGQG